MTMQAGKAAHHLVLGGMRSGKSLYAENLVQQSRLKPVYIATAQSLDEEMAERIRLHQTRRGAEWVCVETPLDIIDSLKANDEPDSIILLDCLTMWLNNLMIEGRDSVAETGGLLDCMAVLMTPVIFVSSEVGLGIIPDNRLARSFADAQGLLNQSVAKACPQVTFIAAGLPLKLKG